MTRRSFVGMIVLWIAAANVNVFAQDQDLDTRVMQATFKISGEKSTATGFLVTRPSPDDPKESQCVLVTAGHVFQKMEGEEATVYLRRKLSEGVYEKSPLQLHIRRNGKDLFTHHPKEDVAAIVIKLPDGVEAVPLPVDLLATEEDLQQAKIHPGQKLLCAGYPHRFEYNAGGFPVLRQGVIASYPLVPVSAIKTFLMSFNTFEGDSGAPVYVDEGKARFILGIVVAQHFIDEDVKTIYEKMTLKHRLGMATVIHATFVRETIADLPLAEK